MGRAFAPGRVNLIGEHTDYNGGLALPFAISRGVTVAVGTGEPATANPYVEGVLAELGMPGAPVRIESDLPAGVGLGSSAALCVATALAAGADVSDPWALARLCSRVENEYAGAHTGLLDQLASILGAEGQGVLIDFSDESWERVPIRLGGARLVVIPSGTERSLAASGYNDRRAECEAGDQRRMRHVETENARVLRATGALKAGDPILLGRLLDESHASLRDDFEVSVPAVEDAISAAKRAGSLGARIMGGGFGGSILALFPADVVLPSQGYEATPATGAVWKSCGAG